ncbi:MAG TPA: substrate-binding domain-containing protein [Candidatus Acidoferrales bacterium]|nr:substrate-binding domain-containing protein [Candidatus Acidoferrales bacterium]
MAEQLLSRLQEFRAARGWSQEELAGRAKLSRAAVSAIELGRVVPSTAAALALARVFGCRVEELFSLGAATELHRPAWAWPATVDPCRFFAAEVGGTTWLYPTERTFVGTARADGILRGQQIEWSSRSGAQQTLVLAGCDPAVGILATELASAGVRLLPFIRSSRQALELLQRGVVHVAGVHLQDDQDPTGNQRAVRELLGGNFTLLHLARWQEGLALAPQTKVGTIRQAVAANLRWVGREPGSGARRCLDAVLKNHRPLPRGYHHVAQDHVAVVETIRSGWAEAGVCVRLPASEAGLDFLVVHEEDYELCFRSDLEGDPRLQALLRSVRSRAFRRSLSELPGYDSSETGAVVAVTR